MKREKERKREIEDEEWLRGDVGGTEEGGRGGGYLAARVSHNLGPRQGPEEEELLSDVSIMTRLCIVADIHNGDGTGKGGDGKSSLRASGLSKLLAPGPFPPRERRQKTVRRDKESCDLIAPYRSRH